MKNFILFVTLLVAGSLFFSCKKNVTGPPTTTPVNPPPPTGPFLYVGGTSNVAGAYWKVSLSQTGGTADPVVLTGSRRITSILTSGNDVYMAGEAAGYWKNGALVAVTGASSVNSLALSGNTVYAAGLDKTVDPAYWTGNTENDLRSTVDRGQFPYEATSGVDISSMAVSGSDVFVTGDLFFENEPGSPAGAAEGNFGLLWKNGGLQLFGSGVLLSALYTCTVGVAVSGTDVYVAGRLPDRTFAGGYWKNGTWNSINNGAFMPSSIAVSGSNVFIPGYTYNPAVPSAPQQAVYWENGNLTPLGGVLALAVTVYGSDIYILGVDNSSKLVVWKNGTLLETLGVYGAQTASCIAIGS